MTTWAPPPSGNGAELAIQREMTRAFINTDPVDVVLTRRERISNDSGGYVLAFPSPLPSQRVKFIPQQDVALRGDTSDGTLAEQRYVLLGVYDADFKQDDEFTLNGRRYRIGNVKEPNGYERKAEVTHLGEQE